jgi:SHS2 domain-containing protein
MTDQATIIAALRTFSARLDTLRNMDITALLVLPGWQKHYEQTLEDAYAALAQVETTLDELAQELEFQHQRLGEAVEQFSVE